MPLKITFKKKKKETRYNNINFYHFTTKTYNEIKTIEFIYIIVIYDNLRFSFIYSIRIYFQIKI